MARLITRRGFTLMELMIAVAIIFVILSIATVNFGESRDRAAEVAVIKMIGTIHTAQAHHQSQHGKFATALGELSKVMSPKLAAGHHSGYHFILQGTAEGYLVTATPEKPGGSGRQTFISDQSLAIRDGAGREVGN